MQLDVSTLEGAAGGGSQVKFFWNCLEPALEMIV